MAEPRYFSNQEEFREWLAKNHRSKTELIVGYHKVKSGIPSMTWPESVDQALCFGWIDGVRNTVDADRYQIRFTPRKPDSIWSAVNLKKVDELIKKGLMEEAGMAIYNQRKEDRSQVYSYENEVKFYSPEIEAQFKQHKKAWEFFESLAPSYKKNTIFRIMSAKQEATQQKRLKELIESFEQGINPWKRK
ncbi:MAG: bacteriocin-protection protein [Bacteroidetes bacterium]|nr:MAG: bacteriocin-protection protein [Bacteroidota bacterium]